MEDASESELNRLRSSACLMFFACFDCSDRVSKEADSSKLFDLNHQLWEVTKRKKAEISKPKSDIAALRLERDNENSAMQDLKRAHDQLAEEQASLTATEAASVKK